MSRSLDGFLILDVLNVLQLGTLFEAGCKGVENLALSLFPPILNLTTEKHCPSHFLLLLFRVPRPSGDEESNLPYYRRFSRGMGLLSSSEENLPSAKLEQSQFPPSPNFRPQKEYIQIRDHHKNPNVPHYRRFARSSSLSTPSPASSSSSEESARPASRLPPLFRYPEPDTGSIIVWPASGRMNAFLGKAKIEEFIKKVRFSGGFQRVAAGRRLLALGDSLETQLSP